MEMTGVRVVPNMFEDIFSIVNVRFAVSCFHFTIQATVGTLNFF